MTNTQIPREAVDAAARALGNHIELDFDVLPADEQHQAREAAVAALNAAAPLLLAGKDAEIERLRGALFSIECAAERADRKGYELDPEDVLDSVRRGLGEVTSPEAGVDEPAESAEPRTWRAGDPEPDDFPTVTSRWGANEFAHREGGWFHTGGCTCCVDIPWDVLVGQHGPLSEVTSTEAGAR